MPQKFLAAQFLNLTYLVSSSTKLSSFYTNMTPIFNFLKVLKRCEGVGRLLLRRPGESIAMSAPPGHRTSGGEDTSADNNMPAEMYVPNQEQWLELRAPMRANMCCQL